ncbi:MAG: 1-(5-phosphoribosyl)-5-amino-4-imidazole-carboxylate carboxylase [Candidatus Glassbacteria bacterium RIFCSPLOWO2_12_FULL_58_11]|uniref:1-(5-phosphoribosyl)-5-amino-4-imidazole-carboxylate carboxylase n=1 Tax=Candidatus Glassbacteria bacterium RIFCSPLOWO2_12_FULL_58_11 TaxID=1817867 RepID=A0A1F5Z189_9BACT|nr:MAG: 1-(5-phosphoribosyl)-5-amino-4-imidazole-carboxylate carboxylase [Candidatus Glassbacteria bacterium RIFCSPLOWO2_12_FULL_58_11]
MHPDLIRNLLDRVKSGELPVDEAMESLKTLPFEELGFAVVDHHRELRTGFPEVIFSEGKTPLQVVAIAGKILEKGHSLLATRVREEVFSVLKKAFPDAVYHEISRIVSISRSKPPEMRGTICVLCAGTSDVPVAEEAAVTAESLGSPVLRIFDVGVAGLHRLLSRKKDLLSATVLIVVAGMEGALASVVGGLVDKPVIAVPTSVGYGASFGGIAALLAMLNSCAAGVTVVNIDNGFGAGYAASIINRKE